MGVMISIFLAALIGMLAGSYTGLLVKGAVLNHNQNKQVHKFNLGTKEEEERKKIRKEYEKKRKEEIKQSKKELKHLSKKTKKKNTDKREKDIDNNIIPNVEDRKEPKPDIRQPEKHKSLLEERAEDKNDIGYVDFLCQNKGQDRKQIIRELAEKQDARYGTGTTSRKSNDIIKEKTL